MSDEGNSFNLINLGAIAQPIASVVCKLLDQLENAVGYILPNKNIKDAEKNAHAYLIEEIMKDERFTPYERGVMVSSYKKFVKENKNQTDIISKGIGFMNENARPEDVEEDWFMSFMDKARLISNEDMQLIWSEILAQEVNEPGSVSKQLLHILAQMSKDDAKSFMRLVPYCVDIYEYGEGSFRTQPIVFRTSDKRILEENRISYEDMKTLGSYGLIKNTGVGVRVYGEGGIEIKYGNKIIYKSDDVYDLVYSNVSLTKAGEELLKITNRLYFDDVLEYIEKSLELNNKIKL